MEMNFEDIKSDLSNILNRKRYEHVLRVNDTALKLNRDLNLNLDEDKIQYACLLHDCAKNVEDKYFEKYKDKYNLLYDKIFEIPVVAHATLGAIVAKERYGIEDEEVLEAIRCHTTGKENMSLLDKLLFISDFIEPGRNFGDADIVREEVYKNFDSAILLSLDLQIKHLINNNLIIDVNTIKARNYLQRSIDE